jgi:hypothetical protein
MPKSASFVLTLISLFLFSVTNPPAGLADSSSTADDLLVKGSRTLQLGTGLLLSPVFIKTERPDLDYAMTFFRGGYLFSNPTEKKFFPRGNLEVLFQLSGSVATDGFEPVFTEDFDQHFWEFALLARYNIVYPGWRVVPYIQIGAGALHNELYMDGSQDLLGQSVEFTPQGSLGFRYILGKSWSLDLEGMFHHISNAGFDDRNVGVNAFGGFVALTWFFGPSTR